MPERANAAPAGVLSCRRAGRVYAVLRRRERGRFDGPGEKIGARAGAARGAAAGLGGRCPAGRASRGQAAAHRRRADESGHARRHRLLVDAALSWRVPVRPAGDRLPGLALAAAAPARHPEQAAEQQGQGLRHDLEQGAEREPAQDRHPQPGREAGGAAEAPARRR